MDIIVPVGDAIAVVDASSRTKAVKITGNSFNTILGGTGKDTIFGGEGDDLLYGDSGNDLLYGEAGNDSLWGGYGNDKFYGGSGDNVFIYKPGEGSDTICDNAAGDMLKILKPNGTEGGAFTSSSFKSNTLTLEISGSGKVIFQNVSKRDTFNINGMNYSIVGKNLR